MIFRFVRRIFAEFVICFIRLYYSELSTTPTEKLWNILHFY